MGKKMTFFVFVGLILAFSLLPASAKATTMVYTDEASFKAVLEPGYSLQEFSGPVGTMPHSIDYPLVPNGTNYKYTVSTDNPNTNLYWISSGLAMAQWGTSIVVTFTGAPVTAVGGNFWLTDADGGNLTGGITLTLNDGTKKTISAANYSTFIGFATADGLAFTSISIADPNPQAFRYPTMNHLYVGADPPPVPEASSLILLGSGLVGLGFYARNRRRK